jgi:hypothetical protein
MAVAYPRAKVLHYDGKPIGTENLPRTVLESTDPPSAAKRIWIWRDPVDLLGQNVVLEEVCYVYGSGLPSSDVNKWNFAGSSRTGISRIGTGSTARKKTAARSWPHFRCRTSSPTKLPPRSTATLAARPRSRALPTLAMNLALSVRLQTLPQAEATRILTVAPLIQSPGFVSSPRKF